MAPYSSPSQSVKGQATNTACSNGNSHCMQKKIGISQWEWIDPGKVDRPAQKGSTTCEDFQNPSSWACLEQS